MTFVKLFSLSRLCEAELVHHSLGLYLLHRVGPRLVLAGVLRPRAASNRATCGPQGQPRARSTTLATPRTPGVAAARAPDAPRDVPRRVGVRRVLAREPLKDMLGPMHLRRVLLAVLALLGACAVPRYPPVKAQPKLSRSRPAPRASALVPGFLRIDYQPPRLKPAPKPLAIQPFPLGQLASPDSLPPGIHFSHPLDEGPSVVTVDYPLVYELRGTDRYFTWVENGRLRGFMRIAELLPGLYRLGEYWVRYDGTWLERALRYPDTQEGVRAVFVRWGRESDERTLRQHLEAGRELNHDIEAYLTAHGLGLPEAIGETRRLHQNLLGQLVAGYFQAFAVAAGTLSLAQNFRATPEELAAQARAKARGGLPLGRLQGGTGGRGGEGERPALKSRVPLTKQSLTPKELDAWKQTLPQKRTPGQKPANLYEIRHTGAKNYEIRGGGEKIDADGIDNDGYALDAKYIDKPLVSPYIPGSDCKDPGRIPVLAQLDDELRRYTAIVHDPSTPIVGLKIITNHPDAAQFFLQKLEQYGLPGYVEIKP